MGTLSSQLESVLRNANYLIQKYPDIAPLATDRTKQALSQLNECLSPGATTQVSAPLLRLMSRLKRKHMLEATSTLKRPVGPLRAPHTKTGIQPVPPRRTDFGQLIVDFGNTDSVKRLPPDKIKDELNDFFATDNTKISISVRVAGG